MATGIVSIAAHLLEMPFVPKALFALERRVLSFALGVDARAGLAPSRPLPSPILAHHGRVGRFFYHGRRDVRTRLAMSHHRGAPACSSGSGSWHRCSTCCSCMPSSPSSPSRSRSPSLAEGINGGWLVSVVAAQSVAALGAQLASSSAEPKVLFFCLVMWLGGGMLYLWIISLIFYRYTFFALAPRISLRLIGSTWVPPRSRPWPVDAGRGQRELARSRSSVLPFVRGLHAHVVGDGNLVDPDAPRPRRVAPRLPTVPSALRPALLGSRLPTRHVHGGDRAAGSCSGCALLWHIPRVLGVRRPRCLGSSVCRNDRVDWPASIPAWLMHGCGPHSGRPAKAAFLAASFAPAVRASTHISQRCPSDASGRLGEIALLSAASVW